MDKLLDELYDEVMDSMFIFGGEEDCKSRMKKVLKKHSLCEVFEDGYGDDGLPVYKCPSCYVEVGEHQDTCNICWQIIVGW